MNIPKENLISYYNNLKECNYTNINLMDLDDVQMLFSGTKRLKLLEWCLVKCNPENEKSLQTAKNAGELENVISNMIMSCGFCKKKEKIDFVTKKLSVEHEIPIWDNIFKTVCILSENIEENESDFLKQVLRRPSKEDFEFILFKSQNIFDKQYCKMKPVDQKAKCDLLKKNIADINKKIEEAKAAHEKTRQKLQQVQTNKNKACTNINQFLNPLKNDFSEYSKYLSKVKTNSKLLTIGPEFRELDKCLDLIIQAIEGHNLINTIKEIQEGPDFKSEDNDVIANRIFSLLNEILERLYE